MDSNAPRDSLHRYIVTSDLRFNCSTLQLLTWRSLFGETLSLSLWRMLR